MARLGFKKSYGLGAVAHAYNPSTLGGRGGWITSQMIETSLGNMAKPHHYKKKNTKISRAWWPAPVVPAINIWEAEVGGSLETWR